MTGGGDKNLKNRYKSSGYLYKILNITKNFIKKIIEELKRKPSDQCTFNTASRRCLVNKILTFAAYDRIGGAGSRAADSLSILNLNQQCLRLNSKGAILIEFAVCMPILIILLFYINDLVRIKRYYSQTEFVAQQIANMIQNVSQKRDNKRLNKNDFKNITSLAWLTTFPGMTKYAKQLGYVPAMLIACIKGLDNGKAHCCWRVWSTYENSTTAESDIHWDIGTGSYKFHTVHLYDEATPSQIHPSLKINPGEYKIILEVALLTHPTWKNKEEQSATKQKYRFYLLNPRVNGSNTSFHLCFNSVVIFTPKPGLFTETAPS